MHRYLLAVAAVHNMGRSKRRCGSGSKSKKPVQVAKAGATTRSKAALTLNMDSEEDVFSERDSSDDNVDSHITPAAAPTITDSPKATNLKSSGDVGDKSQTQNQLKGSSPWRSLFMQTEGKDKGLALSFVSPDIQNGDCVAMVDIKVVEHMADIWDRARALFILGDSPSTASIVRFTSAAWPSIAKPKLQQHEDGYFVILFQSREDRDTVIQNGPYTMGGKPVLLKRWTSNFNLNDELRIAPLWVRFPGLPVIYLQMTTLQSNRGCHLLAF